MQKNIKIRPVQVITMPAILGIVLEAVGDLTPAVRNRLKLHFIGRRNHRRPVRKPRRSAQY